MCAKSRRRPRSRDHHRVVVSSWGYLFSWQGLPLAAGTKVRAPGANGLSNDTSPTIGTVLSSVHEKKVLEVPRFPRGAAEVPNGRPLRSNGFPEDPENAKEKALLLFLGEG